ncbi:MAG TPA: helix-turn-helix domain-containing protein [Pirellulales bacterium]|jgi:hypothetical protein|nr:helix-turn-helix domain-containing protein [Pirellulales bacterium]
MARKLIDQEEAARMLGITAEQVSVLRDRKKLFPYRDGDQWKFKQEDIERYREEMKEEQAPTGDEDAPVWDSGGGEDLENIDLQVNDEIDSILLSEVELGKSSTEGASTIIGKPGEASEDMDLSPAADAKEDADVLIPLDDDADLLASGGSMVRKTESGLKLPGSSPGDSKNVLTGNSALLKSGSTQSHDAGSSGLDLVGDSALAKFGDVKLVPSDEKKSSGSSDKLFGSDALQLSDDELQLMEVGPPADAAPKPAEGSKKGSGSSIKLGDEELEVVMGSSKSGSDLTQSPSDSGIQLISASDSGLSLEEPLSLGSSARRLLDMPEEETGVTQEIVSEEPAELKTDEDFLLTAMDETGSEESSDSGSQVIALDTDDEMSSGLFAVSGGEAGLLEEEPVMGGGGAVVAASPLMGSSSAFAASSALMAGAVPAAPAEAPYSGSNIALLSICTVLLMFCGMMTFDLMRNMWSWDGPYPVNSSIMDSIGKTVGWLDK